MHCSTILFPDTGLCQESRKLIRQLAQQYAAGKSLRLESHEAKFTAAETQSLFDVNTVLVQKTLTGVLDFKRVVWTGVTDFRVDREHIRTVGKRLGLSSKMAKRHRLNPPEIDSMQHYGMRPGMVSPFFPVNYPVFLDAVVLLPWPLIYEEQRLSVAISFSLYESLIVPQRALRLILRDYARTVYPSIPLIELEQQGSSEDKGVNLNPVQAYSFVTDMEGMYS